MARKKSPNPLTAPALLTAVRFDFHQQFVVVTFSFPLEVEALRGEQKTARFLVQANEMEAVGQKFIEAGHIALKSMKPAGSA